MLEKVKEQPSLISGLVIIIFAGTVSGLGCMECVDTPLPQACGTVTECPADDMCSIEQYITSGGLVLYSTGCMSTQRCPSNHTARLGRSDVYTCLECCPGEFCNIEGCGQTASKQPDRGPICFECTAQSAVDTCRDVTQCDLGEFCYLSKEVAGDTIWKSGCLTQASCDQLQNATSYSNGCSMCCQGDFCNDHCQPSSTHVPNTVISTRTSNVVTTTSKLTSTLTTTSKPTSTTISSTKTSRFTPTTLKPTLTTVPIKSTSKPTLTSTTTSKPTTTTITSTTKPIPASTTTTTARPTSTTTRATTQETKSTTTMPTAHTISSTVKTTKYMTTSKPVMSKATTTAASTTVSTYTPSLPTTVVSSTTIKPALATSAPSTSCPLKPVDLIFVLDGSGSVGHQNFQKQLTFVSNFTSQFDIGLNKTRVAVVAYGTGVKENFHLNSFADKTSLLDHINNVHYPNGETYTHAALQNVENIILAPGNGGERNVTKMVIVLTDGRSTEPQLTQVAATSLKNNSLVRVTAIGIGKFVDPVELRMIATDGKHTFQVPDFDALHTIQAELTDKTCNDCKNARADICFVLDSSGSEGAANFKKQLEFANLVISEFNVNGSHAARFCVVTFSTGGWTDIYIDSYFTKQGLLENVPKILYRDGETRTDLGLHRAQFELRHSHDNGIVIVLTDGRSLVPSETAWAANKLHKAGIDVIAIGIGQNIDKTELQTIASGHAQEHVYTVHGFDELDSIHQHVVDDICHKFKPTIPPPVLIG